MTKTRVVVAGLGMVGVSFIEKMLERDLIAKEYALTVLGEESVLAYNRVGLTEFFEQRSVPGLLLNDQNWYDNIDTNHMTYRISEAVTKIDRSKKTVDTVHTKEIPYDILVLATGSRAVLPMNLLPPNCDNPAALGVFKYRTIRDVKEIIDFSESKPLGGRAFVVGGGLLGLEAAKALYDLGSYSEVCIVHRPEWLLNQQLDETAGGMLVEKVREMGVNVMLSSEIIRLDTSSGHLTHVEFKDGSRMDAQMVVYAIGIRSRDELGREAGLDIGPRGGFVVDNDLRTTDPSIYAIGECASWNGNVYGLIAPGVEMADVVSWNLTQAKHHQPKHFVEPDVGTRLKLMGVDVASFGDYFADSLGPKRLPPRGKPGTVRDVVALTYHDPFASTYKKLIFTKDGQYLLGGILLGNITEFTKLSVLVSKSKKLDKPPTEFMVGAPSSAEEDASELPDDTVVCSCNQVTKGSLTEKVKSGDCSSLGELKAVTKAATSCGGCEGTVKAIFQSVMKSMGAEISSALCIHFSESRADLFHKIMVRNLDSFDKVMQELGRIPGSKGCEVCKPTIASILSSLYNRHIMDSQTAGLQETNDRFLGNIQRNGTYSVVPRVSAGEITPEKLIALGEVARKYNLYTKITGGQRVDLFGAQKQDLPNIWEQLESVGFESGHAYGKSLRTVKSCVGTTWCRYGIGDSVGMAVRLEERYKSIRSPHKFKGGVSGCVRDCAEFHNKDFGLCATKNGFSVYVGGNGGMKPTHAKLLQEDVLPDRVIPLLDRYIMFYIRTADRLQRTARWLENLPGGLDYLREVIIDDRLGICDELETQMNKLVGSFHDEWAEAVKNPELRKDFRQFANTPRRVENVEIVYERGQPRPADWPIDEEAGEAKEDFKDKKWTTTEWTDVCSSDDLPKVEAGSSTTVLISDSQIAIFRLDDKLFASQNMCPHRRAFVLSQGIIGTGEKNEPYVSCPIHKRNYNLESNAGSCKNDPLLSIATFDVKEEGGRIFVKLPPANELDDLLSTNKWKVRKGEVKKPRLADVDAKYSIPLPERHATSCTGGEELAW